ncbi:VQ motif [Musa troglodytarum]|uniref:VQ motif n=2 Tax=Musa troglodytarum TaxID=320322 RepID=A0A9E7HIU2_9LILI|nr:VQ motif [Musa troglodytarum]
MEKPHGGAAPHQCPTTFVQTDAATFKELVQRLTGPHEQPPDVAPSSPAKVAGLKRLHERRRGSRLKLSMMKPAVGPAVLSPSAMTALVSPSSGFAGLGICDELNEEEEEKAIKERRFYLHPSPRSRSRNAEPELLPLFPLASPKPHDH